VPQNGSNAGISASSDVLEAESGSCRDARAFTLWQASEYAHAHHAHATTYSRSSARAQRKYMRMLQHALVRAQEATGKVELVRRMLASLD